MAEREVREEAALEIYKGMPEGLAKEEMREQLENMGVLREKIDEATKATSRLRREVEDTVKTLGISSKDFSKMGEDVKEMMQNAGIAMKAVDTEDLLRKLEALRKFIKTDLAEGTEKDIKNMIDKTIKELDKLGVDARTTAEKIEKGISGGINQTFNLVKSDISKFIPAGLEKFGIWGLVIGLAVGVSEKFEQDAANIGAVWTRATGQMGMSLTDLSNKFNESYRSWYTLISREELVKIWSSASRAMDGTSLSIDSLVDRTNELDILIDGKFGSTLQRLNNLWIQYGTNVDKSLRDTENMGSIFKDNKGPMDAWLQTVMDLQSRLGVLGVDVKNVASTLDIFAGASEKAGGNLAQAKSATEETFGAFQKLGLPVQAMLGEMIPGAGESAAGRIVAFQRLINLKGEEFGKQMPELLTGLFEKLGVFKEGDKDRRTLILETQKLFPMSQTTAILLSDLIEKGKTPEGFAKMFSESKQAQHALKDETKDIKELMIKAVPAWTKALEALKMLLMEVIKSIIDGWAMIAAIFAAAPYGINAMGNVATAGGTMMVQHGRNIAGWTKQLGLAAGEALPFTETYEDLMKQVGSGKGKSEPRTFGENLWLGAMRSIPGFGLVTAGSEIYSGLKPTVGTGLDLANQFLAGNETPQVDSGPSGGGTDITPTVVPGAETTSFAGGGAPAPGLGTMAKGVKSVGGTVVIEGDFSLVLSEREARELNDQLKKAEGSVKNEASKDVSASAP